MHGAGQLLGPLSCLSDACSDPQNLLKRQCPPLSEQPSIGSQYLYLQPSLFFLSLLMIFVVYEISPPVL